MKERKRRSDAIPASKIRQMQNLRDVGMTIKGVAYVCKVSMASVSTYTISPKSKVAVKYGGLEERNADIVHCRDTYNMTWREIAEKFGIGKSQCQKIYRRIKHERDA